MGGIRQIGAGKLGPKQRGGSLIELLVLLFVLTIMLGTLFWMLLVGKTIWQTAATGSSNRQSLQVALGRIENELRDSRMALVTNNTTITPVGFSFLSAFNNQGKFVTDSAGYPVWQKYVIYYIPTGTGKLLRKEVYGTFSTALTPVQLSGYCDGQGIQMAAGVTAMSLGAATAPNALLCSITVESINRQGKTDRQTMSRVIFPRD